MYVGFDVINKFVLHIYPFPEVVTLPLSSGCHKRNNLFWGLGLVFGLALGFILLGTESFSVLLRAQHHSILTTAGIVNI